MVNDLERLLCLVYKMVLSTFSDLGRDYSYDKLFTLYWLLRLDPPAALLVN